MSLQRIVIDTPITADDFKSIAPMAMLGLPALQSLEQYFAMLQGGLQSTNSLKVLVGAVQATGTITITGAGPANTETMTLCGVTLTAVTADSGENEFDISATPSVVAANLAAAINESTDLTGIVTAEAEAGVVTVTAVVPGLMGNGLVQADVNLANTTVVTFANGSDGTEYSL